MWRNTYLYTKNSIVGFQANNALKVQTNKEKINIQFKELEKQKIHMYKSNSKKKYTVTEPKYNENIL